MNEIILGLLLLGGVPLIIITVLFALLENKTVQKKFSRVFDTLLNFMMLNIDEEDETNE